MSADDEETGRKDDEDQKQSKIKRFWSSALVN